MGITGWAIGERGMLVGGGVISFTGMPMAVGETIVGMGDVALSDGDAILLVGEAMDDSTDGALNSGRGEDASSLIRPGGIADCTRFGLAPGGTCCRYLLIIIFVFLIMQSESGSESHATIEPSGRSITSLFRGSGIKVGGSS